MITYVIFSYLCMIMYVIRTAANSEEPWYELLAIFIFSPLSLPLMLGLTLSDINY